MTKERLEDLTDCEGSPIAVRIGSLNRYLQYNKGADIDYASPFIDLAECDGSTELLGALEALGFSQDDMGSIYVHDSKGCLGRLLRSPNTNDPVKLADAVKALNAETSREYGLTLRECGEDVASLMRATWIDIFNIAKELDNYQFVGDNGLADAAQAAIEEICDYHDDPGFLEKYIDFERLGRDLKAEGEFFADGERVFHYVGRRQ
ncbi:MAG: antirestriction protein ArdA [Candidatus Enteromonas sp.]